MSEEIEKYLKLFLTCCAVVASIYGAWNVFDEYNADTLELKKVELQIATVEKQTEESKKENTIDQLSIRRDSISQVLKLNAEARSHYQNLKDDGELRDAEKIRLRHLEEIVPEQQKEIEHLQEKISSTDISE